MGDTNELKPVIKQKQAYENFYTVSLFHYFSVKSVDFEILHWLVFGFFMHPCLTWLMSNIYQNTLIRILKNLKTWLINVSKTIVPL